MSRWAALAASVLCVFLALALYERRDDERTLRQANEAGAAGHDDQARRLAATLTEGTTAADAWLVRANIALREGRLSSAEAALRRSLEQRPSDWRAYRDLATVLYFQGDSRGAFEAFSRAAELNPKMPPLGAFGAPRP